MFAESGYIPKEEGEKPTDSIESEEKPLTTPKEYFTVLQNEGKSYTNIIARLAGRDEAEVNPHEISSPFSVTLQAIAASADRHLARQASLVREKGLSLEGILQQPETAQITRILNEHAHECTLVQLSEGMFCIYVNDSLLRSQYGNVGGLAFKVPNGVSFILLPKVDGTIDSPLSEDHREANTIHETQHLVCSFAYTEGLLPTEEEGQEIGTGFRMYREELLCKTTSNDVPIGYTHLKLKPPSYVKSLEESRPEIFARISNYNNTLYALMREEIYPAMVQRNVAVSSLIPLLLTVTSFKGMIFALEQFRDRLNSIPLDPSAVQKDMTDWTFVRS